MTCPSPRIRGTYSLLYNVVCLSAQFASHAILRTLNTNMNFPTHQLLGSLFTSETSYPPPIFAHHRLPVSTRETGVPPAPLPE